MTTQLLSISSVYGGHLENDEGLFTISSLNISADFVTFSLIFIKNQLLSSSLILVQICDRQIQIVFYFIDKTAILLHMLYSLLHKFAGFPIPGSRVQNHWVASRST